MGISLFGPLPLSGKAVSAPRARMTFLITMPVDDQGRSLDLPYLDVGVLEVEVLR
jgi:hypothetical protein